MHRQGRFLHHAFVVETQSVPTSTIVAVLHCPTKICFVAQLATPHVDDLLSFEVEGFWNRQSAYSLHFRDISK